MSIGAISLSILISVMSLGAVAQTGSPEQILETAQNNPAFLAEAESQVIAEWRDAMRDFGVEVSGSPEKVSSILDGDKFIVSHMEIVEVTTGQPGWIESRIKAFDRAVLVAKGELVKTMEETIASSGEFTMFEDAAFTEGNINEIRELSSGGKLLAKATDLADAALDKSILALDNDYDSSKYDDIIEKRTVYENLIKQRTTTRALAEVAGATVIHMGEGSIPGGAYVVVVSLIWTPKMSQVAKSMLNREYNIKAASPGKKLLELVPTSAAELVATQGVRVVVDENGQFGVIAFGQAQPRKSSVARKAHAVQSAKVSASTRARGQLVQFVRASVLTSESLIESQVSREFTDTSNAIENVRQLDAFLSSKSGKIKLVGIRQIKSWVAQHPVTGQTVTGAVIGWTPSSQNEAESFKQTLRDANEKQPSVQAAGSDVQLSNDKALKSIKIDIGNY